MDIDSKKRKEALEHGTQFGFIPRRLEIAGRPELNHFPFNVLFMSFAVKDGKRISGSAIYEPDLNTFKKCGDISYMIYNNIYGGNCRLLIVYHEKTRQYSGEKYINGQRVGLAVGCGGDGWKKFFIHFTLLGLSNGEQCKFENT